MTNSELKQRLTDCITLLSIPGVGRGRYRKLVDKFGSPARALAASKNQLEAVPGLSHGIASAIKSDADPEKARSVAARIIQLGWTVLFSEDSRYPSNLKQLDDHPPVLFVSGELPPDDLKISDSKPVAAVAIPGQYELPGFPRRQGRRRG